MYQSRVPLDMKQNREAVTRGRKDGDFQISRGRIGVLANLYSQRAKMARKSIEANINTISYGVDHPTAGA